MIIDSVIGQVEGSSRAKGGAKREGLLGKRAPYFMISE